MKKLLFVLFIILSTFALHSKTEKFDLILINRYKSPITLKLNKSKNIKKIPQVDFYDFDNQEIKLSKIYRRAKKGKKEIKLDVTEAALLKNVQQDDEIIWPGFTKLTSEKVKIKEALDKRNHIVHFTDKGTILTNVNFEEIYQMANESENSEEAKKIPQEQESAEEQTTEDAPQTSQEIKISESNWQFLTESQLSEAFGKFTMAKNKIHGIKSASIYKPDNINTNANYTVMLIVHGTWADKSPQFYEREHPKFQEFMKFAQDYADENNVGVELISFGWPGTNKTEVRIDAAKFLAKIINAKLMEYDLITVAHSHGCNVVNAASNLLNNKNIDHIINLATPVREVTDPEFRPTNFNTLFQFYSTSDLVALAGAVNLSKLLEKEGSIRKYAEQENRVIKNIRTQINGKDPGHSAIIALVPYLFKINQTIKEHYIYDNDLDLNLDLQDKPANQILISVRHMVAFEDIFDTPAIKNKILSDANEALQFLTQMNNELEFSRHQEQLFNLLYGYDMHMKGYLISRFASGVINEAWPYIPSLRDYLPSFKFFKKSE